MLIMPCGSIPAAVRETTLWSAARRTRGSTIVALPADTTALAVGRSAELFLGSLANPNTIRGYATAVGKTADRLGEHRPLAAVADDEVGDALETLWGRAAVGSWLSWCRDRERESPGGRVGQEPGDPGFGDAGALRRCACR